MITTRRTSLSAYLMWLPLKKASRSILIMPYLYSAFLLLLVLCTPHNELLKLLHLRFRLTQTNPKRRFFLVWLRMKKEKKKYKIGSEHYTLYEEVEQGAIASIHCALCKPLKEIVTIKILDFKRDNWDLIFQFFIFCRVFLILFYLFLRTNLCYLLN